MKIKRRLFQFTAAALVFAMFTLAGCGKTETESTDNSPVFTGEKTVIANEVLAGYSIVRPESTDEDVVRAGVELRNGLNAVVQELTLTTDWVNRGEEVPVGTKEILIGKTNRPESISLSEPLRNQDFSIGQVGERIVIVGGSNASTRTAVDFFLANFVDAETGQVYVPAEVYTYTAAYPVDTLTLNGVSIQEYKVYGEYDQEDPAARELAIQLADTLTELTGYTVDCEDKMEEGKYICFSYDENAGDTCAVFMEGENLCITAADQEGMVYAYAFLYQKILEMEALTGTGNVLDIRITEKQVFDLLSIAEQEAFRIYVSPNGTEDGHGSAEKPYGTIQAAMDAVRHDRKLQPMEIILMDGDYYLTESVTIGRADGGNRYASLTIRAQNSGNVRLIGGVSVDPAQCQPVTDTGILDRVIDDTAAEKLMMLDISGIVEEIPEMQDANPVEIFFDGQALARSRWPNSTDGDGYLRSEEILAVSEENYQKEPATFTYTDAADRAAAYWSEESMSDLYILSYLGYDWYSDLLKVTEIDPEVRTVTTEVGGTYLPKAGNRFFFCNLLEEIDEPGESYIDRKNGIVYYYPYAGEISEVFVSTLNESMFVLDGCTNLYLEGISFEYSRQNVITAQAVDSLTITDCDVLHIADNAMDLDGYRITVDGCEIADIWSGGIFISGGDRVNLISSENEIKNCVIHDVNRSRVNYKPGVRADSVGLVVRNNTFYNAIHVMISIHNNNVLIAYNEIYNCATDCSDMGAIYFGRDPSLMGIEIAYNYFHDIGNNFGGYGQQAIFMDDGNAGAYVHHNLFCKATVDVAAVKFHAAQYAVVEHNIFADAPAAVYNGAWTYTDGKQYYWLGWVYDLIADRQHAIQNKIAASGMESDRWREYYKDTQWAPLFDIINDDVRQQIMAAHENGADGELNIAVLEKFAPQSSNVVSNNVFFDIDSYEETGEIWTDGIVTSENNVPVTEDAFVSYGSDFTLTEEGLSAVREIIPDFENFPMDEIGPASNG